mmetsp:Transcript_86379/g.243437  ORF Transcript_86379/g.243437 Transcript_86379/m.243437 type:complete len:217 (-) Transcript_86379:263-913(-)
MPSYHKRGQGEAERDQENSHDLRLRFTSMGVAKGSGATWRHLPAELAVHVKGRHPQLRNDLPRRSVHGWSRCGRLGRGMRLPGARAGVGHVLGDSLQPSKGRGHPTGEAQQRWQVTVRAVGDQRRRHRVRRGVAQRRVRAGRAPPEGDARELVAVGALRRRNRPAPLGSESSIPEASHRASHVRGVAIHVRAGDIQSEDADIQGQKQACDGQHLLT